MKHNRLQGFTLVEMIISFAVIGIMLAVGIPSFKSMIASQRVKSAATTLQSALNLTRAEALKRNTNVTLSPVTSGQWNSGWNVLDPSTGKSLFAAPAVTSLTITGPTSVIYQSTGRVNATANNTFKISSTGTTDIRCVEVDLSGIAIVTSSGC